MKHPMLHGFRVSVRLARDEDLEEIHTMDRRLIGNDPSSDTIYHVAEIGGTIPHDFGTAHMGRELVAYAGHRLPAEWPGVAFLSRSGVLPECRGIGLQKRLIRARLAYLRREGLCSHAMTYTMIANAPSANSLIACGFKLFRPVAGDFWIGPDVNYWRRAL